MNSKQKHILNKAFILFFNYFRYKKKKVSKSRLILEKYWGFKSFRPLQEDIIDNSIYGHDTLAILPTGGGKSICFQIPGIAREGLTLVISPLIALMEDQVTALQKKGINAEMIASSMTYREIDITLDNARFGQMKFLYTSPERLKTALFIERFKEMKISLIVVDEAHCISEWGHDFRPSYLEISSLRDIHPSVPIIALTASATQRVQDDIVRHLSLKNPKIFKGSIARPNISYQVHPTNNKLKSILTYCQKHPEQTGIVYCQTRRSVKFIVTQLRALNLSAGFYHGGLKTEDKQYMFEHWMQGNLKIMVATNAFGMGIDKPDVRYVLHYEIPNNLEAYYQEAGRAGRDNDESVAIAFWEQKDLDTLKDQLDAKYPPTERVKQIFNSICNFLSIASGSGEGESYDFDIQKFHSTFKVPILEVYYSLKILQLNGNLSFSENSFHPTRLKFAIGNSTIYKFQVTHERVAPLIMLLTRSYPGIFDRFIRIDENELSKRLKITKKELQEQLLFLENHGVADINFQSNLPRITLLTQRYSDSELRIKPEIHFHRKKIEYEKLNAITQYITADVCRANFIQLYFTPDEEIKEKCGKCDTCIDSMKKVPSKDEFWLKIKTILPCTIETICTETKIQEEHALKILRSLILDEKIKFENEKYMKTNLI